MVWAEGDYDGVVCDDLRLGGDRLETIRLSSGDRYL